jgi:hypothetical protein
MMDSSDLGDNGLTGGMTPPTDILVAGLPGPLMEWTLDLLARAMAARYASVAHLPISGDARWAPPDPASPCGARLFTGDFLQEAWATQVRNGQIAAVLAVDDAGVAWDRLRQLGQLPAEAIRNLVAVATSFGDLAEHERVLTVTHRDLDDPTVLAVRVLTHIGLRVETLDQVFAAPAAAEPAQAPRDWQPLIEAVVAPAFAYGRSGSRVPTTWPRDCLFWGDSPGEMLPRVLDLTGPSRILAYGPYLALPPGRWTMSTTIAFSPASRGAILSLTLHGATELGRIEFTVAGPGLFKASVPVTVPSPREQLEIRLVTERGAIEGTIGIDHIAFEPD